MKKKRIMKWRMSFLLLLFPLLVTGIPREARAQQEERLTVNLQNASLKEIINEIKRLSGYDFVYSDADLVAFQRRDVNFREVTLDVILSSCLKETGLGYTVNNRTIVLREENRREAPGKRVISGVVTDARGEPLPGVTVMLVGTTAGVATDADGKYTLDVPDDGKNVLRFSFIGMITREVPVEASDTVNVRLEEENLSIDEVVVTGYFERSKNTFTGAFTSVKREELREFGNVNLLATLQMIDPSFKIREDNERGSDPNTLPTFFVRGESSFMGANSVPTFIVDGNEVSLQYIFDMDLDRIESMNILKDASATIHYGSRAANGVVVIETRRPAGGKFSVSYANRTSFSAADLSQYNLLNAREKLEYEMAAGLFTASDPGRQHALDKQLEYYKTQLARGVNTDWLAQPTRNAMSHSHSAYIEGGSDAVVYGLSTNYGKNGGVIKKSSRENAGLTFDLSYRVGGKVNIRNRFSYGLVNVRNSPYGSFSDYARANPYNPVHDEDGKLVLTYPTHYGASSLATQYNNPLYNASLPYKDEEQITSVTNDLSIDYFITPKLRYKGAFGLSKTLESKDKYLSPDHTTFANVEDKLKRGNYTVTASREFSYTLNSTLAYSLEIDKHLLYTGVGLNILDKQRKKHAFSGAGFLDERFHEIQFAMIYPESGHPTGTEERERMIGLLGSANYSYDDRYFVDLSGRVDGSSKYGKERQFAPFWSGGIGWNVHKENFVSRKDIFSRLTLRASVGTTGNQQFDPYMAKTILQYSPDYSYYQSTGAVFVSYGNKHLEWQKSTKYNIGLAMELFERRFTLRFDGYDERTSSLLLPVSVPPSLGFVTYTENYGEQSNRGFEFDFTTVIIRKPSLDWAVNISGTRNKNRVEKISDVLLALNTAAHVGENANLTKPIAMYEEGESLSAIKVVRSLGINPATGKELFLTREGKITETWDYRDKVTAGDTEPLLQGNIGTNLIWKEFSLSVLLRYAFGGQVYNSTLAERVEGASPYANADARVLNERWREPGDLSFYKDIADRSVSNATSRFVQDNNFLNVKNISLSYRFSPDVLKKWGISTLRLGLNTSDLFYFSTVKRERGIDYPFARQFTFSLNLNF